MKIYCYSKYLMYGRKTAKEKKKEKSKSKAKMKKMEKEKETNDTLTSAKRVADKTQVKVRQLI